MRILTKMLKQTCVYWPPVGSNPSGETIYGPPQELKCRWEDIQEQYLDVGGNVRVSNSRVYTAVDVKIDGILWLGTVETLVSQSSPMDNPGAYAIRKFSKIPTLRGNKFLRFSLM